MLLQRTEELETRLVIARWLQLISLLLGGIVLIGTMIATLDHLIQLGFAAAWSLAIVATLFAVEQAIIRPSRRQLNRDQRALYKAVEFLRETVGVVTMDLSPLDEAELRVRLSRFPIGTDLP
jgi:membrane protein implicated in regulation of membrane protease activity